MTKFPTLNDDATAPPANPCDGMSPADVSQWARTATHQQAEQTHSVVMYGHHLKGVHTRWIGIDCKPPGDILRKKKIKLWLIRYVIDGYATLTPRRSPGTSYNIEPGMVVWSTPEAEATQTVTGPRPLRAFSALLLGDDMPERFSQAFSSNIGCRRVDQPGTIESVFAELFLEAQSRNIHRNTNCEHLTSILLNRITTHLDLSDSFAGEARLYFQQARTFLDANYATIHNVVEVAEHCGLTRQYLGRVFKAFSGVSPHQHLSNLRMYHARDLLITTDTPIQDVAQAVGYEDPGLFARNFRKIESESPRAFRARFRR